MSDLSVNVGGSNPGISSRSANNPAKAEAPRANPVDPSPPEKSEPTPARHIASAAAQNPRLSIEHDAAANRYVFKSIDPDTGEVIRQFPTKDILSIIARIRNISGLTVDQRA